MPDVSWGRMRTFLRVADLGSVRAAAADLHITEPAVSAALAYVAKALGADLFVKRGRGIELSEAGRIYADYARTMIGLEAEARAAIRAEHGLLRLGAVESASETLLPELLASFRQQHPNIEVSLAVLARDALFTALGHHEIDLAIAGRPPRGAGLVTRARRANSLIAVAAPGAADDPLTATWLLRGPGSGTRGAALGLLASLDAKPPTLTLGAHAAVVAAARRGLGVTLVHANSVGGLLSRGELIEIPLPGLPLDRPWHLVSTANPTKSTKIFIRHAVSPDAGDGAFTT